MNFADIWLRQSDIVELNSGHICFKSFECFTKYSTINCRNLLLDYYFKTVVKCGSLWSTLFSFLLFVTPPLPRCGRYLNFLEYSLDDRLFKKIHVFFKGTTNLFSIFQKPFNNFISLFPSSFLNPFDSSE